MVSDNEREYMMREHIKSNTTRFHRACYSIAHEPRYSSCVYHRAFTLAAALCGCFVHIELHKGTSNPDSLKLKSSRPGGLKIHWFQNATRKVCWVQTSKEASEAHNYIRLAFKANLEQQKCTIFDDLNKCSCMVAKFASKQTSTSNSVIIITSNSRNTSPISSLLLNLRCILVPMALINA
eukprot:scaffold71898_cov16-Prasinocladus_malaysianus.AAC.1